MPALPGSRRQILRGRSTLSWVPSLSCGGGPGQGPYRIAQTIYELNRDAYWRKPGDVVTISSPQLGALINRTQKTEDIKPWTYGISSLFRYLSRLETGVSLSRAGNCTDSRVSP